MGEFDRIARYLAPLAGPEGLCLADDAALHTPPPGFDLVMTKDMLAEGVHVPTGCVPDIFARRALRSNLSDLAAMGAKPLGYLLGLSLPPHLDDIWLQAFCNALGADQLRYGLSLWGGDSICVDGPITVSITALGLVPAGTALRRDGAQPGDDVFVSGFIGQAAAGLHLLNEDAEEDACGWHTAYVAPEPRISLGDALRGRATAAIDVSDGLVADVGHIATTSKVSIALALDDIPVHPQNPLGIEDAITAGDDYELAFTAPQEKRSEIFTLSESLGLRLTKIGQVRAAAAGQEPCTVLDTVGNAVAFKKTGWQHG
ncbi:MAG: thiamine-phosphate kinase [Pseudomonadota bacterium]